METRLDRARRNAKTPADLIDGQVPVVAKRDHDRVIRGEGRQGGADDVAVMRLPDRVARRDRDLFRDVPGLPAGSSGQPVPTGVDENPVEPRLEAVRIAERRPLAPRLNVGVMRGVLRLRGIPEDRASQAIRGVEVLLRQAREGNSLIDCGDGRPVVCHVHDLERLAHDDMTNGARETFRRLRFMLEWWPSIESPRHAATSGPEELARRRRSAITASVAAAIVATALVALDASTPSRILLWPVATAAAVTWLQVIHRFCVAFGAFGQENFGRLGEQQPVDPRTRVADRRRAFQLILEGAIVGLIVTLLVGLIPG
jgi:hypothetical protein